MTSRPQRRTWRSFRRRERAAIRAQLARGGSVRCPRCRIHLEARPDSRLTAVLPDGATGYDLDCRGCRQFLPQIRHTGQSLYHLRMRRLAAAVLRA